MKLKYISNQELFPNNENRLMPVRIFDFVEIFLFDIYFYNVTQHYGDLGLFDWEKIHENHRE